MQFFNLLKILDGQTQGHYTKKSPSSSQVWDDSSILIISTSVVYSNLIQYYCTKTFVYTIAAQFYVKILHKVQEINMVL